MSDRPLVSIIVPSFNQGRYIRETLDSILSQDYRPIEVLVMDGGSTDETTDVLKSYNIPELQWVSEPDHGVADAVNKGIARAAGEIIAVQSSDDLYKPGAISTVVGALQRSNAGLLYGDMEFIDARSTIGGRTDLRPFDLAEYAGKVTYVPQPAAFFRAAAARDVGPWREDLPYACDAEFYLRIAERFGAEKIDGVLAQYRHHDEQRDTSGAKIIRDWTRAIEPWTHHRDSRVRRYARGGIEAVRHRYTPEAQWARRSVALYRSVLKNPALLRYPEVRRHPDWIFGREPIWRALSRLKQWLRRRR
ncbi:MAG TPA: glycosyltransferase [Thermoanaerobaculia bacterium]|jgi:glycosyltransferase involved in cell wall biosynthesis